MKHKSAQTILAILFATGFSAAELHAQNPFFADGDLILYFQKPGEDATVFVGLGSAANLYRGSAAGATADRQALNIVDLNATLTAAYGAGWASDTGIYAGVAGCRSNEFGEDIFDGDQTRTLYVSRARNTVGTLGQRSGAAWDLNQAQSHTTAATSIVGSLANDFETNHMTQVATAPASSSRIDDTNPFTNVGLGIQAAAFNGAFAGGVQQRGALNSFGTFGPAGSVEFALDLNRIVPFADSATIGEVSGVRLIGSYEGTVVVGTNGMVSFITQAVAPTSAYNAWLLNFPLLSTTNDKLPATDFDNDGYSNLEEFVLNGNPSVSDQTIAPTLNASGTDFVFNFTRRADSTTEVTQSFEYSTDLMDWTTKTPITIPTTPGTVGFVTVGANTGTAPNQLQAVTLTIPKGADAKLFGRLKAVK